MSKRLILCFDGTWDRPPDPGVSEELSKCPERSSLPAFHLNSSSATNVLKLYQSIPPRAQDGRGQQKWYDCGTEVPWFRRFRTGTFGYGLDQTILQGYAYLVATYEPGDDLFIYGFSRGAYAARALIGWLSFSGLLSATQFTPDSLRRVRNAIASAHSPVQLQELAQCLTDIILDPSNHWINDAYHLYRNLHSAAHTSVSSDFRPRGSQDILVTVLGLWDTVGPLGIPTSALKWLNEHRYNFHDTDLSPIVARAYHALALDEHRADYNATLWTSPARTGQTIEQCWFSGAHEDVGGGYEERDLAEISLRWIQQKSMAAGLSIEGSTIPHEQNPFATLHDSFVECLGGFRKWFHSRFYRPVMQTGTHTETLDDSVRFRLLNNPGYRPNNEGLKDTTGFR
ncbi:MAG: DUF2235 domain-containing protein [Nitrospira sp.]